MKIIPLDLSRLVTSENNPLDLSRPGQRIKQPFYGNGCQNAHNVCMPGCLCSREWHNVAWMECAGMKRSPACPQSSVPLALTSWEHLAFRLHFSLLEWPSQETLPDSQVTLMPLSWFQGRYWDKAGRSP